MSQTMGTMGTMGTGGAAGAMGAMGATLPESAEWPPLFVDVLNKTRGGIVDPLELTVHVPPPGDLDKAAAMARWAPGVRQHVALLS